MSKKCSCGQIHEAIPASARVQEVGDPMDGVFWECECGSTLFIPIAQFRTILH